MSDMVTNLPAISRLGSADEQTGQVYDSINRVAATLTSTRNEVLELERNYDKLVKNVEKVGKTIGGQDGLLVHTSEMPDMLGTNRDHDKRYMPRKEIWNILLHWSYINDTDHDTYVRCEQNPDEDYIRFGTAGVERMYIDNAGNLAYDTDTLYIAWATDRIGVNTNAPDVPVHIYEGNAGGAYVPFAGTGLTVENDTWAIIQVLTVDPPAVGYCGFMMGHDTQPNDASMLYSPVNNWIWWGLNAQQRMSLHWTGLMVSPYSLAVAAPTGTIHAYVGVDVTAEVRCESNTFNPAIDARFTARVVAGDALLLLEIAGATLWYVGCDNADADKLKIGTGAAVGTNMAITVLTTGNVGINTATPNARLEVLATTEQFRITYDATHYRTHTLSATSVYTQVLVAGASTHQLISEDVNSAQHGVLYGDGTDIDWRWSVTGATNAFFVQGSNGYVGINTNAPLAWLNVLATTEQLRLSYDATHYQSHTVSATAVYTQTLVSGASTHQLISADINSAQHLVTYGDGTDIDWNWSVAGAANAFFVQGSNGFIGVGTGTPATLLNVLGTTEQLRLSYDATNYFRITVAANAQTTISTIQAAAATGHLNLVPDGWVSVGSTAPAAYFQVYKVGATNSYYIRVSDVAISTSASVYLMSLVGSKTAGVTTYADTLTGINTTISFDQVGGEIGSFYGYYCSTVLDNGTVGNAGLGIRNMFAGNILCDMNGGTVTGNAVGFFVNVDQEGANTVSGYIAGIYADLRPDGNTAGAAYGIGINFDQAAGKTITGNAYCLGMTMDCDGTVSGTSYLVYGEILSNIDYGIYLTGVPVVGMMRLAYDATNWMNLTISSAGLTTITTNDNAAAAAHLVLYPDGYVAIGNITPTSLLDVNGDIETTATGVFYFGDPSTNNSWRVVRSGNDLSFQRREGGAWVEKGAFTAA